LLAKGDSHLDVARFDFVTSPTVRSLNLHFLAVREDLELVLDFV
jgi:hypothetical protein